MPIITKRWEVASPPPPGALDELSGFSPVLQRILYNRGYRTIQEATTYLAALPPEGTDPFNLLQLPQAVERIQYAIHKHENIVVYGDYDADGVTATALLGTALEALGAKVREYIPNRFDEGYGLNLDALRTLHDEGARLVITVDCGIRSYDEAELCRSLGMDLIITDHHFPLETIPPALAVINPKQAGDTYIDKNLAGVGLAYKLASALYLSANEPKDPHAFLDLVAIGTIADMVPLTGENRHLVRSGLESLRFPQRQGIMALIGASGLTPARITTTDVGYVLAPRLNAAGRLDSAMASLKLMTSRDIAELGQLAQWLEIQNRRRQEVTREIQARAERMIIVDDQVPLLLFAADPDFNPGVVGLAASRLTDQYYRPAIVANIGEEFTRASCRSIPEFHITKALDECADLLEHHGGHAAAAGFTVRNERLGTLMDKLREIASQQLADLDLRRKLSAEAELQLKDLKPDLLKDLDLLQPTGMGNQQPIFMTRRLKVSRQRAIGKDNAHLKLTVTDGRLTIDAIAFQQGQWIAKLPPVIDLMYNFELNEFNGQVSLQLNIKDIKEST